MRNALDRSYRDRHLTFTYSWKEKKKKARKKTAVDITIYFFLGGHGNDSAFGVAEYISTFAAIFHKCITFFQLGNIFKQRSRSEAQADN